MLFLLKPNDRLDNNAMYPCLPTERGINLNFTATSDADAIQLAAAARSSAARSFIDAASEAWGKNPAYQRLQRLRPQLKAMRNELNDAAIAIADLEQQRATAIAAGPANLSQVIRTLDAKLQPLRATVDRLRLETGEFSKLVDAATAELRKAVNEITATIRKQFFQKLLGERDRLLAELSKACGEHLPNLFEVISQLAFVDDAGMCRDIVANLLK